MKTVYYNVHVPKNAGTTFDVILMRHFGDKFLRYGYGRDLPPGYICSEKEKKDFFNNNEEVRCISGHVFRYPAPAIPEVTFLYILFLRHPVDRLISLYAYEKLISRKDHFSHRSVEEWIDFRLKEDNALTNYQAFHVIGTDDPKEVCIERAKEVLDSFFFVGISEMFDESIALLNRKMKMGLPKLWYRKRRVTGSKRKFPISENVRERLLNLNQIDLQLYEYALSKLQKEITDMGPSLASEVNMNKTINKAIDYLYTPTDRIKEIIALNTKQLSKRLAFSVLDPFGLEIRRKTNTTIGLRNSMLGALDHISILGYSPRTVVRRLRRLWWALLGRVF